MIPYLTILKNPKVIIGAGIVAVLFLSFYFYGKHIENKNNAMWEQKIKDSVPVEVRRDTLKAIEVPQPVISGTATSVRKWNPNLVKNLKSDHDVTDCCVMVDSVLQELDYYRWVSEPYSVETIYDTSGAELELSATPRESAISYVLKPAPKVFIPITVTTERLVLTEPKTRFTLELNGGKSKSDISLGIGLSYGFASLWYQRLGDVDIYGLGVRIRL
jgi:hypothetical protein